MEGNSTTEPAEDGRKERWTLSNTICTLVIYGMFVCMYVWSAVPTAKLLQAVGPSSETPRWVHRIVYAPAHRFSRICPALESFQREQSFWWEEFVQRHLL